MHNPSRQNGHHGAEEHTPALREEVIHALLGAPRKTTVDGTAGSGGHTEALLSRLAGEYVLLASDIDPRAVARLREKFAGNSSIHVIHGNYADLPTILRGEGLQGADAVLLDLGFSSAQITAPGRGMSFSVDDPLDMRFDQDGSARTAADALKSLSQEELEKLFWDYGEERHARKLARAIVSERKYLPIERTTQLADLVLRCLGRRALGRIHPATRVFQALRISVNRELENLATFMERVPDFLNENGRVCVISYHSLEDRIVKSAFRHLAKNGIVEIVTPKPIRPTAEEVAVNPRARSAKLRVARRSTAATK